MAVEAGDILNPFHVLLLSLLLRAFAFLCKTSLQTATTVVLSNIAPTVSRAPEGSFGNVTSPFEM